MFAILLISPVIFAALKVMLYIAILHAILLTVSRETTFSL